MNRHTNNLNRSDYQCYMLPVLSFLCNFQAGQIVQNDLIGEPHCVSYILANEQNLFQQHLAKVDLKLNWQL